MKKQWRAVVPLIVLLTTGPVMAHAAPGLPHWIGPAEDRTAGQEAILRKSFDVKAPVTGATLNLVADFTQCRVMLNDTVLVDLDEYAPWLSLDVTQELRTGRNEFRLHCRTGRGPAAIALSLQVACTDGRSIRLITDPSWKSRRTLEQRQIEAAVVSFGRVAPELWNIDSQARVSAFDNYQQWKQAKGAEQGADPATFATQPGFTIDLVRSAGPDEGSWVSMAFDPQGRLTVAREDKGLLRFTLSSDGRSVEKVETVNETLRECRGLLYAYDSLFASANNSKGLYRLRDLDGNGEFDEVILLRKFPGNVGHGRNDLTLGPDGLIYNIHGDAVDYPKENVLDRTSPLRTARRGEKTHEGRLLRTGRNGETWEVVASGLRNPFGIAFNADGEIFTWDADNEYDMGAPWYRPTRLCQLVSGADFGWRRIPGGHWPPRFHDSPDNALPVVDIGKGSPTALKSGQNSSFPERYRKAIFALDWAYGRILACHLSPRGAGYACRVEEFLQGRPFNATDLGFGPNGSLYVVTGGRKTQSALYRIRYVGEVKKPRPETRQQAQRRDFGERQRELRRELERFHQRSGAGGSEWLETAARFLSSPDPVLRNAARVALEHRPVRKWKQWALNSATGETAVTAWLALARTGTAGNREAVLQRLGHVELDRLSPLSQLSVIHAYRLCLADPEGIDPGLVDPARKRLLDWFVSADSKLTAPLGSGLGVKQEPGRLAADLHIDGCVPPLIELLKAGETQEERMLALYALCHQKEGWTLERRRLFFEALRELERSAFAGQGMPVRLRQIRGRAAEGLTDQEKQQLGDLLKPASDETDRTLTIDRPFVREWTLDELVTRLADSSDSAAAGDASRGAELFREVRCIACHRFQGRGGVLGPDLTSVARRFSRQDLLTSILKPSKVIAEKYRSTQIVTTEGKVLTGQVLLGGDYRSPQLRLIEDPLRPGKITEILKQDIERHRPADISPMPKGLLNTLTADEINDLLAFLTKYR